MNSTTEYFETRFVHDERREKLWQVLWQAIFRNWIDPQDCVLELGAGYGHFINQVEARKRIAVDMWPGFLQYLKPDVEGHVCPVVELGFVKPKSVDFAF